MSEQRSEVDRSKPPDGAHCAGNWCKALAAVALEKDGIRPWRNDRALRAKQRGMPEYVPDLPR